MSRPRRGLCYHKASGRYYVTDPASRKEVYFGKDQQEAERRYYVWRFAKDDAWSDAVVAQLPTPTPDGVEKGIRRLADMMTPAVLEQFRVAEGKIELPPTPQQPTIKPTGTALAPLGKRWAESKIEDNNGKSNGYISETKRCWTEFCRIVGKHGVCTLEQLTDKEAIKQYRATIKRLAQIKSDKPDYWYSVRFRRIKAIFNHILDEFSYVTNQEAASIRTNLRLLKTKSPPKSPKRPITPDELHALLAVCDRLAVTDKAILTKQLADLPKRATKYQQIAGQLRQADNARYLGIQYRAIYLMSVNCLFYPVDVATIPWSAINPSNGHVNFRRRKKDTPRVSILFEETRAALKAWMDYRQDQSPLMFVNVRGSAWNRNAIGKQLENHRRAAGLPEDLTFSSFRDGGYSGALVDTHVDVYSAKVMAGHATGMTDDYVEAQPERCRLAVESIHKHYFGGRE